VAADYTRNIVFNVNDKAIKRATDRITKSLTNIERTLKRIEGKGFNNLAKSAEKASKQVFTTTDSIQALDRKVKSLTKANLGPISTFLKTTSSGFKNIQFFAKRSGEDLRTIFELFKKGQTDIMTVTTAIGAAITGVKNLGTSAKTNLTLLGSLLDANNKKAQTFVSTLLLGSQMGGKQLPLAADPNILAINTAIARQNSMRGNVLRNTIRSERSRTGSDFLDFSIGADQIPRVIGSRGRPANMQGPDRPGIQDPIAKSIRRNQAKRDKILQKELRTRQRILSIEKQVLALTTSQAKNQGFKLPSVIRNQFNEGGAFFNSRGRAGRIAGAAQSGLIGGGFPLLFGQSPGAALAGGLGGALGGALGPGFGFAGSIVATAAAQKITEAMEFRKEIEKLNKSIRLTGGESEFSVASIKKLGKELGLSANEALQAARSFEAFGAAARMSLIKVFGDEATFNTLKNLRKTVDILNNIETIEKKIGKERADQAVNIASSAGGLAAQEFILKELSKLQDEEAKNKANKLSTKGFGLNSFRASLSSINQFLSGDIKAFSRGTNPFIEKTRKDILDANASAQAAAMRNFNEEKRRLEARDIVRQISEPKEELRELMDPLKQLISLSKTVGDSFSESFRGIVRGSMTAQEALRNLFMRTADHFLDMAAQMIAKQIQMSILGIGLKFFSSGIAPSRGANTGGTDRFGRDFDDPDFGLPLANGGIAKAGRTHLVGERGPELFTPGVTGTVTPNHALGGSTNVVVNVDASGSSVQSEGDGQQFGEALATAIQLEIVKQKRSGGLLA